MRDLEDWIEAQLTKGHSKEEIRSYLLNLNYPNSDVAKVDAIILGEKQGKRSRHVKRLIVIGITAASLIALLLLLAYALPAFKKAQPTHSQQETLLPIGNFTAKNGDEVEIYDGMLAGLSETHITVAKGEMAKEFPISQQNRPSFISSTGQNSGEAATPKLGDNLMALFLVKPLAGEPYVSNVVLRKAPVTP